MYKQSKMLNSEIFICATPEIGRKLSETCHKADHHTST